MRDSQMEGLILPKLIDDMVFYISREKLPGAILIFLSGISEINSVMRRLKSSSRYPKGGTPKINSARLYNINCAIFHRQI